MQESKVIESIGNSVCNSVFDVVSNVLQPATGAISQVCGTMLDNVIRESSNFGFGTSLSSVLSAIKSAQAEARTAAVNKLCGIAVCKNDAQANCKKYSVSGKTSLAVVLESNQGLCELVQTIADSACFPLDAEVHLEGGNTITMGALNVGDKILTADGTFEEVYFFSSRDWTRMEEFIRIHTDAECSTQAAGITCPPLTVTPGHYVFLATGNVSVASQVTVGDTLVRVGGQQVSNKW